MGWFDRFKKKKETIGKEKKPKHVVASRSKDTALEQKKKQFAAVPAAGVSSQSLEKKSSGPKAKDSSHKTRKRSEDSGDSFRILMRSVISEKVTALGAHNQYVFAVSPRANKIDVRRAVFSLYGVRPLKVNIINVRGKELRYGRTEGHTKNWKKAVVTLQPGQAIDVFGG